MEKKPDFESETADSAESCCRGIQQIIVVTCQSDVKLFGPLVILPLICLLKLKANMDLFYIFFVKIIRAI